MEIRQFTVRQVKPKIILLSCNFKMSNEIIVSTNDGKIRGIKNKSPIFDAEFYSFYGIPYAEPPIGDLRFKVNAS